MSKYINVKVNATLHTDFYIEVSEEATQEEILKLAEQEIILPHRYPFVLDDYLKRNFNLSIRGLDSMLKAWDLCEIGYEVDNNDDPSKYGGNTKSLKRE